MEAGHEAVLSSALPHKCGADIVGLRRFVAPSTRIWHLWCSVRSAMWCGVAEVHGRAPRLGDPFRDITARRKNILFILYGARKLPIYRILLEKPTIITKIEESDCSGRYDNGDDLLKPPSKRSLRQGRKMSFNLVHLSSDVVVAIIFNSHQCHHVDYLKIE